MVKNQLEKMNALILRGDLVNAIKLYFAEDAITADSAGVQTISKHQMKGKIDGFLNAISNVNKIKSHRSMNNHNAAEFEFTFHSDIKDGCKIQWYEIIRRIWNADGKAIHTLMPRTVVHES